MSFYSDDIGYKLSKLTCTPSEIETLKSNFPNNVIIRIFGFAGSGKGTLSAGLSKHLNLPNIESSLIWRGITYIYNDLNLELTQENSKKVFALLQCTPGDADQLMVFYKNTEIPREKLKSPLVDSLVAKYSSVEFNRELFYDKMIEFLTQIKSSCILDGRGAYPRYIKNMEQSGRKIIRIFLDASDEIKAFRYHRAKLEKKLKTDPNYFETAEEKAKIIQEFQAGIVERNKLDWDTWVNLDMGTITPDTAVMDTTDMTPQEADETALKYIGKLLNIL